MSTRSWTLEDSGARAPVAVAYFGDGIEPGERVRVVPLDDVLDALRTDAAAMAADGADPAYVEGVVEAGRVLEARFSSPEGEAR